MSAPSPSPPQMLASATALVAIATPATGASGSAHPQGPVSHATGVDSRAEQDSVRAFWTKSRLKAAMPRGQKRPLRSLAAAIPRDVVERQPGHGKPRPA